MEVEPPGLPAVCTSSNCSRCLIDSTGETSGMDSFAIRWSIADGGGEIGGFTFVEGSLGI